MFKEIMISVHNTLERSKDECLPAPTNQAVEIQEHNSSAVAGSSDSPLVVDEDGVEKNIDDLFIRDKYLNEWRKIKYRGVSAIVDCAALAPNSKAPEEYTKSQSTFIKSVADNYLQDNSFKWSPKE